MAIQFIYYSMYSSKLEPTAASEDAISEVLVAKLAGVTTLRYIKLGPGGAWANQALEQGKVLLGFREVEHETCDVGDWSAVGAQLEAAGRTPSGASQGVRELRDFYELDANCLWITFANGHLYWAFAEAEITPLGSDGTDGPRRVRNTLGGWQRQDVTGAPLPMHSLSSALTRVSGYRMTICNVDRHDYALRRIRGEVDPILLDARKVQADLEDITGRMIANLDWRDFEVLVDLVFARSGWQRQSAVGRGEVDVDLLLTHPTTDETAWVQVKSRANQSVLDDYLERFHRDGSCDRFFFVCHSAPDLVLPKSRELYLWTNDKLARIAVNAGLFEWVARRVG